MLDEHECFQEDVSMNVHLKLLHWVYVIWNTNVSLKELTNQIQREMYVSAWS